MAKKKPAAKSAKSKATEQPAKSKSAEQIPDLGKKVIGELLKHYGNPQAFKEVARKKRKSGE